MPISETSQKVSAGWAPEKLTKSFRLNKALETAVKRAEAYMNKMLGLDDMMIQMQQKDAQMIGIVVDQMTGREVRSYEEKQILTFYAQQQRALGTIVDGRV